jgi:hypothetical protein
MRIARTAPSARRVSRTLQRLLSDLYRTEPLEQRILLSADPVGAILQMSVGDRTADPGFGADAGETIVSWEEVSRGSMGAAAPSAAATDFPVDGAAFDASASQAMLTASG